MTWLEGVIAMPLDLVFLSKAVCRFGLGGKNESR